MWERRFEIERTCKTLKRSEVDVVATVSYWDVVQTVYAWQIRFEVEVAATSWNWELEQTVKDEHTRSVVDVGAVD